MTQIPTAKNQVCLLLQSEYFPGIQYVMQLD